MTTNSARSMLPGLWRWQLFAAILVCLSQSSCNAPTRMTHLKDTLRDFSKEVRWGMIAQAARHVSAEKREAWLQERMGAMQSIRLTDVQIGGVSSDGPRATTAKVYMKITWYRLTDNTVHQSVWEQNWVHKKKHGWLLEDESPAKLKKVPVNPSPSSWP